MSLTLGMVCVYCAGNLGVFLFFFRQLRSEFSSSGMPCCHWCRRRRMIYVGYKTVYPAPDPFEPPASYAPYLVAVWLGLGICFWWR